MGPNTQQQRTINESERSQLLRKHQKSGTTKKFGVGFPNT